MTSPSLHVTAIRRYPVKSLRGHALESATVEARGIAGDRRWMVVDADGRFITRREMPQMAPLDVLREEDGLCLSHPDHGTVRVARPRTGAPTIDGRVWRDTVRVHIADTTAGDFLSAILGKPVHLVYQQDDSRRAVDPDYASPDDQVSLADGFPLLLAGQASLDSLNASLAVPIGMDRFRANIVIAGAEAWAEDHWRLIRIGDVELAIVKPCARCIITTQDPLTGARKHGNDPLTTLRKIGRMAKGGIIFGQNAVPRRLGTIRVGDAVDIVELGESNLR